MELDAKFLQLLPLSHNRQKIPSEILRFGARSGAKVFFCYSETPRPRKILKIFSQEFIDNFLIYRQNLPYHTTLKIPSENSHTSIVIRTTIKI